MILKVLTLKLAATLLLSSGNAIALASTSTNESKTKNHKVAAQIAPHLQRSQKQYLHLLDKKVRLKHLLSLEELESLSIYERDQYLRKVVATVAKMDKQVAQNLPGWLSPVQVAEGLFSFAFPAAVAELRLQAIIECVGGMNVVVSSPGRASTRQCPAPSSAAGYSCPAGQEICNPWHYGVYKSNGQPVCMQNATNTACAAEAVPGENTSTRMVYDYELRGITGEQLERIRAEWRANSWYLQYICEGKVKVKESQQSNEQTCRILKQISDQARARRQAGNTEVAPIYIEFPDTMTPVSALNPEQEPPAQVAEPAEALADSRVAPESIGNLDVLLLGDSQTEGQYGTYLRNLLSDLSRGPGACEGITSQTNDVSLYAVGSSSPRHWNDTGRRDGRGSWFCSSSRRMRMHLPGQSSQEVRANRLCEDGRSPFQGLIRQTDPDVVVMTFGVNSIGFRSTVRERVETMLSQLPPNMPCLFVASPPSVLGNHQATEDQIAQALQNFNATRTANGQETCAFIPGRTATNVNRFEANRGRYLAGDGYHLQEEGAQYFANYVASEICANHLHRFSPAGTDISDHGRETQ
ncbi:MAG: SGNH/GDSL hydrolase family protein [Bdellovibrionales bacterium]|nr:SGNH/GDSL hydrolase family protein [Bdellovibrionales bacterium]